MLVSSAQTFNSGEEQVEPEVVDMSNEAEEGDEYESGSSPTEPSDAEDVANDEDEEEEEEDDDYEDEEVEEGEEEEGDEEEEEEEAAQPPPKRARRDGNTETALANKKKFLDSMRPAASAVMPKAVSAGNGANSSDYICQMLTRIMGVERLFPVIGEAYYQVIKDEDAKESLRRIFEAEMNGHIGKALGDNNVAHKVIFTGWLQRYLINEKKPRDVANIRSEMSSAASEIVDANRSRGHAHMLLVALAMAEFAGFVGASGEVPWRYEADQDGVCVLTGKKIKKGDHCYYVRLVKENGSATHIMLSAADGHGPANAEVVVYMHTLMKPQSILSALRVWVEQLDPRLVKGNTVFSHALAAKLTLAIHGMIHSAKKAFIPAAN